MCHNIVSQTATTTLDYSEEEAKIIAGVIDPSEISDPRTTIHVVSWT